LPVFEHADNPLLVGFQETGGGNLADLPGQGIKKASLLEK